jgi:hypothetical protein
MHVSRITRPVEDGLFLRFCPRDPVFSTDYRLLTTVYRLASLSMSPGAVNRSVIVKRSIVIASVGQRMAHRPQRMQRSSSFTIAESGRPLAPVAWHPASAGSLPSAELQEECLWRAAGSR